MATPQQTIIELNQLSLKGMAESYSVQLSQPKLHEVPFDDRFAMLVDGEARLRERRRLDRMIKKAEFPEKALLEELDDAVPRALDKKLLRTLASCEWVNQNQNVILTGPAGIGKSWLACALALEVCRRGLSVLYRRVEDVYDEIEEAAEDRSLPDLKAKLLKPRVLILDDVGFGELTKRISQVMWSIVERRMRTTSLILTSQYKPEHWKSLFQDPTVADALLDRIVHKSHHLDLQGESVRKFYAKKAMKSGK